MNNQENILKYIKNTENPYQFKIQDMIVSIEYSKNNKSFNECIQNILRQKMK